MSKICILETRLSSFCYQCIYFRLVEVQYGICFSTFQLIGKSNSKSTQRVFGEHNYSLPPMDVSTLVPQAPIKSKKDDKTSQPTTTETTPSRSKSKTSIWVDINNTLCQSYSSVIADIIIDSLRRNTRKQYGHYIADFQKFQGKVSFTPNTHELLNYLAYEKGLGYSALNTARSAISAVSTMLGGTKIGEDPIICRFLRGVFNTRPSLPRFTHTWDPEVPLKYLDFDSKSVELLPLSRKVVFLVTLLAGQRVATVAGIKINDVEVFDSKIVINIGLIKQSRPKFSQQPIVFSKFNKKPNLCVFSQLSHYINLTGKLRPITCQNLFVTTTQPHRAASVNTLANWIKHILRSCNLESFSAHSLRGSGTSAALRSGSPIDSVLQAAGWSQESTFRKFYDRPVYEEFSLDKSILDSTQK